MHTSALDRQDTGHSSIGHFQPHALVRWIAVHSREIAAAGAFAMLYVIVEASRWLILSRAIHARRADGVDLPVSALEAAYRLIWTPFIFWLLRRLHATPPGRPAKA